jgi:hypothetical protein
VGASAGLVSEAARRRSAVGFDPRRYRRRELLDGRFLTQLYECSSAAPPASQEPASSDHDLNAGLIRGRKKPELRAIGCAHQLSERPTAIQAAHISDRGVGLVKRRHAFLLVGSSSPRSLMGELDAEVFPS